MSLTIHPDLVQGSDEWLAARRGIVTASVVGQLISTRKLAASEYPCPACGTGVTDPCVSKRDGKEIRTMHPERTDLARADNATIIEPANNDTSRGLTFLLASERITGWTEPTFMNDAMMRGVEDEPRARAKYSEHTAPVMECGFMVEDRWGFQLGYSPDGVVGDDGLIEVKSRSPKIQVMTVVADEVPTENMAQLQCGLLVSGRSWCDYISYAGGMNLWRKRVYPDEKWFAAILAAANAFEQNAADIISSYRESVADLPMTERTIENFGLVI
ncbi:conserved hypothetical protein [uncultured Mycobacterium sp.]|uniref:Uncharacterized protein n=1 Tax=uncultured Mycobacterium sp. TaxID=171292 RepID=A0A1Y5PD78_9MYCO|nr:conserved hypothetical protein [uncultured Mycobacterium sp.]